VNPSASDWRPYGDLWRLFTTSAVPRHQETAEWRRRLRTTTVPRVALWLVASWIRTGCSRPLRWDQPFPWGGDLAHRRQRDGRTWIVFSSRACAAETLLTKRTVLRALAELIRLGVVACYVEADRPENVDHPVYDYRDCPDGYELVWFGPNTRIVRVAPQPPTRAKATPSWAAS
jgi:hypothetical protein